MAIATIQARIARNPHRRRAPVRGAGARRERAWAMESFIGLPMWQRWGFGGDASSAGASPRARQQDLLPDS
jgi:hypothetical protein